MIISNSIRVRSGVTVGTGALSDKNFFILVIIKTLADQLEQLTRKVESGRMVVHT